MDRLKTEEIEDLLKKNINNNKITGSTISCLTKPGENYAGVLLKVDLTLTDEEKGSQKILHTVAKLPPTNEFLQQLFNFQELFDTEMAFYEKILPQLQKFQIEQDVKTIVHLAPRFYGTRKSLDERSEKVDKNAVLILENLKELGYKCVDRLEGFDLETGKLILEYLAAFHAIPLALQLKTPNIFENIVQPHLAKVPPSPPSDEEFGNSNSVIIEVLKESTQCRPLVNIIQNILERAEQSDKRPTTGPFVTMVHADLWVNNIMVKFDNDKPIDVKFLDFQSIKNASCAVDVFFFLFSSIKYSVLQEHFNDLLKHYYGHFIKSLKELDISTSIYSYEKFLDELGIVSKHELANALFMLAFVVFDTKGGFTFSTDDSVPEESMSVDNISLHSKERVWFIVAECNRRGWLI